MKTITAFPVPMPEPMEWTPWHESKAIFHRIDLVGPIRFGAASARQEGQLVRIDCPSDFADPSYDICVLVAKLALKRKSGVADPNAPMVWFWQDRFWTQAIDKDGLPYYRNKCYAIYEIAVQNGDELLGSLKTSYDERPKA